MEQERRLEVGKQEIEWQNILDRESNWWTGGKDQKLRKGGERELGEGWENSKEKEENLKTEGKPGRNGGWSENKRREDNWTRT